MTRLHCSQAFYHALASLETVTAAFCTARATAMFSAPAAAPPTFLLLPEGSPEHDRPFFAGGGGGAGGGSARLPGRASSSASLASDATAAQSAASLDPQGVTLPPLPSANSPSAAVPPPPLRTSRSLDAAEDPSPVLTDATPALAPRRGAAAFASVFPDVVLPPAAAAALAPPAPAATPFATGSLYAYSRPDSVHYAGVRDDGGDDFTSLVDSLPRMPEHFVGRSIAMAKIVAVRRRGAALPSYACPPSHALSRRLLTPLPPQDCQFSRMITILGPQGSGKSALAVAVAHWFALRRGGHADANLGGCAFPNGVIYVDVRAALDAWGHAPPGNASAATSGRRRGAAAAPTPVPVSADVAPWMSPVSSGSVTPAVLRRAAPRSSSWEVSPREAVILGLFRAVCPGEWDAECTALRTRLHAAANAAPQTPASAATSPLSRSAEISKRRRGKAPAGHGSSSLADFHPPLPRQRGPQQHQQHQQQYPPPPRTHHTRRGRRLSESLREDTPAIAAAAAAAAGAEGLPWPPAAGPHGRGAPRPKDRHLLRTASAASVVAQDTATEASDSPAAPSGRGRSKGGRGGGNKPSHKRVPAPWPAVATTGESGTEEDYEVPFEAAAGPRGRGAAGALGAPAAPPAALPSARPIDADRLLARVIERLRPLRCLLVLDNLDCEGDAEEGRAPQPRQQGGWGLAAPPPQEPLQQSQQLWQQSQAAAYRPYGHALGLQYAPAPSSSTAAAAAAAAVPAAAAYPYAQGLVLGASLPAPAFTSALWPDAAAVTPAPPVGFGSFDASSVGDLLGASYFALASAAHAAGGSAGAGAAPLGSQQATPATPDSVAVGLTNDDAAPVALPPSAAAAATDDDASFSSSSSPDPWGPLAPVSSAWVKAALLRHLVVGPHHLHVVVTRRRPLGSACPGGRGGRGAPLEAAAAPIPAPLLLLPLPLLQALTRLQGSRSRCSTRCTRSRRTTPRRSSACCRCARGGLGVRGGSSACWPGAGAPEEGLSVGGEVGRSKRSRAGRRC